MAQQTIFYSWQSDLPNGVNRSFIETCLNKAIKELRVSQPKLDPCLDRDTANMPGSPDIAATILDKIDNCSLFVCDVSIVQDGSRPMPNPNVLFELGYAVKQLGWDRVICVANEHFGAVERLPFDVRQRRVKCYTLSPDTTERTEITKAFTKDMRREIEFVLTTCQSEGERLQLQFGDVDTKTPLGPSLHFDAVYYSCDTAAIPDYHEKDNGPFGAVPVRLGGINRDYHRQLAEYVQHSTMVRKLGFVVFNGNKKAINDVTLQIALKKSHGLVAMDDPPGRPSTSNYDKMMSGITPIASYFTCPGKLTVNVLPDRYEVKIEFGKVQPEANAWSEPLYLGVSETCNLELTASLYGDELTVPKQVKLYLDYQVTEKPLNELSDEEWVRLVHDSDS